MDNMLEHPGTELQVLIKEKGLTQKAFASILGKKVSEVNELLKGKRNITIQRDYLLHQTLGTPIKYRILKQVDYDYSLIDINDKKESPFDKGDGEHSEPRGFIKDSSLEDGKSYKSSLSGEDLGEVKEELVEIGSHSEQSEESTTHQTVISNDSEKSIKQSESNSPLLIGEGQGEVDPQETPIKEPDPKDDEDYQNRVRIFKSF